MEWLVLAFTFRGQGASTARVGAWRRLKRFGAVSPRHGLWVLPKRAECLEAAQWLSQEVEHKGGEALVMTVSEFEGIEDADLISLFRDVATARYQPLLERISERERRTAASAAAASHGRGTDLARLEEELADIRRIDYFDAPEGQRATSALRALRAKVTATDDRPVIARRHIEEFQGRAWVTRPRPHVDRLACAWLIRRFIDPDAAVRYRNRPRGSEVGFDMPGGEFEHVGPLCTFEVMLQAFAVESAGLREIADIVHEIDLRDGRTARPETSGVEAILAGWQQSGMEDGALEAAGLVLFDGLQSRFTGSVARG